MHVHVWKQYHERESDVKRLVVLAEDDFKVQKDLVRLQKIIEAYVRQTWKN